MITKDINDLVATLSEDSQTCSEFFANYMKIGIGSGKKSDLDSLFIYLIVTKLGFAKNKTLHEISISLGVPENTIKRYIYEGKLKYQEYSLVQVKEHLKDILKNAKVKKIGDSFNSSVFSFVIEDQLFKNALESEIIKLSGIPDYSFNSKLLEIDGATLSNLIISLFEKDFASTEKDLLKYIQIHNPKYAFPKNKNKIQEFMKEVGKSSVTKGVVNLVAFYGPLLANIALK